MTDNKRHEQAANVAFYFLLACVLSLMACFTYAGCTWLLSLT